MRVLLTGGGTGGHVYPALAVAAALRLSSEGLCSQEAGSLSPGLRRGASRSAPTQVEVLYVGTAGGMEADVVARAGLPFRAVESGALRGRSPLGTIRGLVAIARGLIQALRVVGDFRPQAVLATGGYVSVPVVLAAWLLRRPVLVYLPDVEPGLAVMLLARFAARVAVSCDVSKQFLPPGKVVVTGYPVRPEFLGIGRDQARAQLGLPKEGQVALVFGGSRGAQALNEAVASVLPELLARASVIHVSGAAHADWLRARRAELPAELASRYHVHGYLHHEMGAALAAADLVVSRSGASVLGELPAFGLPGILVPYPHAGAHQRLNAEYLARNGAAVVLDNSAVRGGGLVRAVLELLSDPGRLKSMSERARELSRPDAAGAIGRELRALAERWQA